MAHRRAPVDEYICAIARVSGAPADSLQYGSAFKVLPKWTGCLLVYNVSEENSRGGPFGRGPLRNAHLREGWILL